MKSLLILLILVGTMIVPVPSQAGGILNGVANIVDAANGRRVRRFNRVQRFRANRFNFRLNRRNDFRAARVNRIVVLQNDIGYINQQLNGHCSHAERLQLQRAKAAKLHELRQLRSLGY